MFNAKSIALSVFAVFITALMVTNNIHSEEGKSAMSANSPVVLINSFTVPEGKLNEAITSWEAARDFLAQQPGYISTKLHQSLSPDAQYRLINVAEWESPGAFKSATAAMQASSKFPPVDGLIPAPALYTVIRN